MDYGTRQKAGIRVMTQQKQRRNDPEQKKADVTHLGFRLSKYSLTKTELVRKPGRMEEKRCLKC